MTSTPLDPEDSILLMDALKTRLQLETVDESASGATVHYESLWHHWGTGSVAEKNPSKFHKNYEPMFLPLSQSMSFTEDSFAELQSKPVATFVDGFDWSILWLNTHGIS